MALEARDVAYSYGDRVALGGVDLEISPGVLTGLLGPNGAGKTTLMRIMLGVLAPDRGEVLLDGVPVDSDARRHWGYMPQERGLYPGMQVGEQVVYFARLHGLTRDDATARARRLLGELGMADRWDQRTDRLSGGLQQRLQLATAVVHDPEVVVLDEPFAGLDPLAVEELSQSLRDRARAGATVLFSSHQLDLVQNLCEDILMVNAGRIVLRGPLASLRAASSGVQLRLRVQAPDRRWLSGFPGTTVVSEEADEVRIAIPPGTAPPRRPGRRAGGRSGGRLRPRPALAVAALPRVRGAGRGAPDGTREVRMTWGHGMALVLERGLREQLRSRTFKIVTAVLLLLSIAAVVVPRLVTGGPTTYTLATVGRPAVALTTSLDAAARAADFHVVYVQRLDEAAIRSAVQHGEATVGLVGERMYVPERTAGPFPGIVAQSLVRLETLRVLTDLGLTSEQVARLDSVRPPEQVFVASTLDQGRATIGYAVGLVLYLALLFSGQVISMAVANEKASRISEVLLAVLRPSQILVGTVLSVATVAILQLLVLAVPVLVGASVTGASWLPAIAVTDVALAITWFVLGFCLFAFLYAAGGALVDKVTEAGTAVLPVTMLIIGGYLLGVMVVIGNPGSAWSVLVSLFPLTAPLTMPIRWASGEVPVYQLALSLGLTALAGLGSIWLASTIYRRALVITGHRVHVRELIRPGGRASGQGAR